MGALNSWYFGIYLKSYQWSIWSVFTWEWDCTFFGDRVEKEAQWWPYSPASPWFKQFGFHPELEYPICRTHSLLLAGPRRLRKPAHWGTLQPPPYHPRDQCISHKAVLLSQWRKPSLLSHSHWSRLVDACFRCVPSTWLYLKAQPKGTALASEQLLRVEAANYSLSEVSHSHIPGLNTT